MNKIILASKSIGRKHLFDREFGDGYSVSVSNIDESRIHEDNPSELARKLALLKAKMVAKYYHDDFVLGFDTVVLCEGEIIGKPRTREIAKEMLTKLSCKEQKVISGYALIHQDNDIEESGSSETLLKMRELNPEFIDKYVVDHPVTRFAGGYGVQDKDDLIEIISGDMDTVIGAPMSIVLELLKKYRKA